MYVKHITDFMRQQLHENKAHKIYLVKDSRTVVENHRTVTYYDIREANLLDKARFNLRTESSLHARAVANIELSCALESMRKQELVAIENDEVDGHRSFAKMGVQYLTRKDFANMQVDPRERASQLTGINFQDMTEKQWLRFEKIERFLHFVQKERHLPGAIGDNVSLSGMSTASGIQNWEDTIKTGEAWRLFVIRNDEHFVASERAARRNASVAINPKNLEVMADFAHTPKTNKTEINLEEERLKRAVPDDLTRRGRSEAMSHESRKAFIQERKRAVLELEVAEAKKKDVESEDVIVKKQRSPAKVGSEALKAKTMHFNDMAAGMNAFLDTALHETRAYLEKTSTEPKLPIGPGKFSAEVKYDDKPATPHKIVGADEHKDAVPIPHPMIDHVNKPRIDNKVVVYATIENAAPEPVVKKPASPTKLAEVMASPLYASIDLGQALPLEDESAPGYETIGGKKAPAAAKAPESELYSYVTVQNSPNRIAFVTEEEENADYVNTNKKGEVSIPAVYTTVQREKTPPLVAPKPQINKVPPLPLKEPPPKPVRVDSLIKTPGNPAV